MERIHDQGHGISSIDKVADLRSEVAKSRVQFVEYFKNAKELTAQARVLFLAYDALVEILDCEVFYRVGYNDTILKIQRKYEEIVKLTEDVLGQP
jgi:hypothetical protein